MANFSKATVIRAPGQKVWRFVREFSGADKYISIMVAIEQIGDGIGAIRIVTLADGSRVVDRLEGLDEQRRTISYSILQSTGPLPFSGYVATMHVRDAGTDRCEVDWSATYAPKNGQEQAAEQLLESVYSNGFAGLKAACETSAHV